MKDKKFDISWDIRKTSVVSILIHGIILLIFLLFQVSAKLDLPEFVEVSFTRGGVVKSQPQRQPSTTKPQESGQPQKPEEKPLVNEKIELPKRKMLEEERPDITARSEKKKLPSKKLESRIPKKQTGESKRDQFLPETDTNKKEKVVPEERTASEKRIPDIPKSGQPGFERSFEIEGKAAERKIFSKTLPKYPENYRKEGRVRIRFTILPNGMVGEMIPILKTDAVLEKNTLRALRKWRFNPLPREAPQEPVEGIITFQYKLK